MDFIPKMRERNWCFFQKNVYFNSYINHIWISNSALNRERATFAPPTLMGLVLSKREAQAHRMEAYLEVPETAVPQMATWGLLQKWVNAPESPW